MLRSERILNPIRKKILKLWEKDYTNREIEKWLLNYDELYEKENEGRLEGEILDEHIDLLKEEGDYLIEIEKNSKLLEEPIEIEPIQKKLEDELQVSENEQIKEKVQENKEQIKLKKAVETIQKALLQLELAGKIPKDSVYVRSYMRKKYVPKETLMPPKKNTIKEKPPSPQQNQEINPIVEEEEEVPLVNRRNSELTEQQKEWVAFIYGDLNEPQKKKITIKEIENLAENIKSKDELLKKVKEFIKNKKKKS